MLCWELHQKLPAWLLRGILLPCPTGEPGTITNPFVFYQSRSPTEVKRQRFTFAWVAISFAPWLSLPPSCSSSLPSPFPSIPFLPPLPSLYLPHCLSSSCLSFASSHPQARNHSRLHFTNMEKETQKNVTLYSWLNMIMLANNIALELGIFCNLFFYSLYNSVSVLPFLPVPLI